MDYIVRHSAGVRITHWTIALSGILLLFSGFGQLPMYARYNIVKIPGFAWSSNFEITLLLHYLSAALFTAAVAFHLLYHFRRREFAILPRKGDMRLTIQGLLAMVGLKEEPPHEKFQAKQRVIYAVIGATTLVLIATGLLKSYKNLGAIIVDPLLLEIAAFIHTGFAMIFMLLVVAHVAALMLKSHRPMIPSMITGKMDKEHARAHHPRWKPESGDRS